jgi:hypothetical protein
VDAGADVGVAAGGAVVAVAPDDAPGAVVAELAPVLLAAPDSGGSEPLVPVAPPSDEAFFEFPPVNTLPISMPSTSVATVATTSCHVFHERGSLMAS